MSTIQNELKRCHQLVWQRRAEMEDVWPTPDTADALRFAFTEAGEAMDAHIRKTGKYARNRDKELSVRDELADCAMMLLTAMSEGIGMIDDSSSGSRIEGLTCICFDVTTAMAKHDEDPYGAWPIWCDQALGRIAVYPEIDLYSRIGARLDRIEKKQRKHGKEF